MGASQSYASQAFISRYPKLVKAFVAIDSAPYGDYDFKSDIWWLRQRVKSYNKAWAKNTGFPLVWIPNAAHNSNVDNPDVVNSSIMDFVKNLK